MGGIFMLEKIDLTKKMEKRRISKKNQCAGEKACTVTTSVQKFKYSDYDCL